jgi:hypothetical protein
MIRFTESDFFNYSVGGTSDQRWLTQGRPVSLDQDVSITGSSPDVPELNCSRSAV